MSNITNGFILLCLLNILISPNYINAVIADEDVELNSEPTSEVEDLHQLHQHEESAIDGKVNPNTCMNNKPFVWKRIFERLTKLS